MEAGQENAKSADSECSPPLKSWQTKSYGLEQSPFVVDTVPHGAQKTMLGATSGGQFGPVPEEEDEFDDCAAATAISSARRNAMGDII